MKMVSTPVVVISTILFTLTSMSHASSTRSLLDTPCKKVGSTTTNLNKKLTCVSISGVKIWRLTPKARPSVAPSFNIKYQDDRVTAAVIVNGQDLQSNSIEDVMAIIYAKVEGNYYRIGTQNWKVHTNYVLGNNYINFSWPLSGGYRDYELAVEIKYKNSLGFGDRALKAIIIPTVEPLPTISPTPTSTATPNTQPTQSATPVPVSTATPVPEVGCPVNYLSSPPYASQRIAILNMSWEKDALGYVVANASMRNDNSMALRLVEFSFYMLYKGSLIYTTSTLEGNNHFFIQGDAKFNSTDGVSGPWLPGQVRTFKMPTNRILECRSITVTSSGFSVKQGIGAN